MLAEERKRLEEMLERTDRMMAGVKRGLDEMRAAGAPEGGSGAQAASSPTQPLGAAVSGPEGGAASSTGAAAVPLARQDKGPREGAPVWQVVPPTAQGAARD